MAINHKTLSQQVAEELRELIRTEYKPGDRLPSVEELAARYQTSTIPVREGLLALAHEGLVIRKRRWGTFVAEPPADDRCVAIFSELDNTLPECSHFFRRVPQELRRLLQEHGVPSRAYIGLLAQPDDGSTPTPRCDEFFHDLAAGRFSGVIEFNSQCLRDRLRAAITEKQLLHVRPSYVRVDYDGMLAAGFRRLQELGCRRVAVLGVVASDITADNTAAREATLRRHFAAARLTYRPEWCRGDLKPNLPGAGWEMFREIWAAKREKPDGLLVTDDVLFSDASKAILAQQIAVPEKLRVVTHSNRGNGLFYPFPVDRLEVDPDAFATHFATRMLELLRGETPAAASPVIQARLITAEAADCAVRVLRAAPVPEPVN